MLHIAFMLTSAAVVVMLATPTLARDNSSSPSTPRANTAADPRSSAVTSTPKASPSSGATYVPFGNGYIVKQPGQPDLNCQPFGTTMQCK